jgi:peptide/nickel transport system permease protein
MFRYLIGRILQMIPVLIGVSIVVFMLVRLIPGSPAISLLGQRATPALIRQANKEMHLTGPIWSQYFHYVSGWFHGDFGVSFFYDASVWSLTLPRIPVTLELVAYATILALLITFPLAFAAAMRRDRASDHLIRLLFTTTLGMPSFWLGIILALYLGVKVKAFPIAGAGSSGFDRIYHLTLPALTIALAMTPLMVRALRSSLIEVISSDFVRTARACGIRRRYLVWNYLLRNSMVPLVTVVSINIGFIISGTVIVEQVFGIPGIGSLLIGSISTRDYSVIQLITLVLALFVLVANLATDVIYGFLDPRINLSS